MAVYSADLHIHTVLSPCAEVEMIPPLIVERAVEVGLDIIGITDHNSAENVEAVIKAAEGTSLKVLPGMECESVEGVHILCLFGRAEDALEMQEIVYENMSDLPNKPETFGPQFVVDATGDFIRYNDRLLIGPTELTIEQIVGAAAGLHGLVMPSHIDRPSYGIYGVLGFLPEEPVFQALEVSRLIEPEEAKRKYADAAGKRFFQSSDAHRLEEIGSGRTMLKISHRTVEEILKSL